MTATVTKKLLHNARALIADSAHWTGHVLACADNGRPVMWYDREAFRWCALGALHRAAFDLIGDEKRATGLVDLVIGGWFPRTLSVINDSQGHAAVLQLFDQAIAAHCNDPKPPTAELTNDPVRFHFEYQQGATPTTTTS